MISKPLIAIVDDDPELPAALNSLVRAMGYSAESFSSARQLLQSPRLNELSCVLSDVHMPEMNGFELTREIRAKVADLPVILMTGRLESDLDEKVSLCGAKSLVYKPFDSEDLYRKLRDAMGRRL